MSQSRQKLRTGVLVAIIISVLSLLFSILAIVKIPDTEYYARITGNYIDDTDKLTYQSNQYVEDKRSSQKIKKDVVFSGSNGNLPITVVDKIDTIAHINYVSKDTEKFITDDDQTKLMIHNSGSYLIGYNVIWNDLVSDLGSARETLIQSSSHKILVYSRDFTHKSESLQQHMVHMDELNEGEWIRLIFKQNSGNNVTISAFNLWLKLLQ